MNKRYLLYGFLILLLFSGCKKSNEILSYHKFKDQTWSRFDKITFNIPIIDVDKQYDVYFFANHTKNYEFDNLRFNMIMTTPSGEERIKDYKFMLKNTTGGFVGECRGDSCTASIVLRKGMSIEKIGMLRIEIETLVPRLQIENILGIGIRLVPSAQ